MPMPVLMGMYTPVLHQFLCLSLPPSHPGCCSSFLDLALPTTAPDSNNAPQIFYTAQELDVHCLKDHKPTVPRLPTVHIAPVRPKRDTKRALGKQATIGLDSVIHRSGGFRASKPLEKLYSHPCPGSSPNSDQLQRWKSSAPLAPCSSSRTGTT